MVCKVYEYLTLGECQEAIDICDNNRGFPIEGTLTTAQPIQWDDKFYLIADSMTRPPLGEGWIEKEKPLYENE
jgi:hypothetical protein